MHFLYLEQKIDNHESLIKWTNTIQDMIDQLDSGMEEMNHKSSSIERERDKTNVE
jgi:hypothetical protein